MQKGHKLYKLYKLCKARPAAVAGAGVRLAISCGILSDQPADRKRL